MRKQASRRLPRWNIEARYIPGVISQHGLIATAAADGARIWDASTGEPLTPLLPHAGGTLEIASAAMNVRRHRGFDGSVRLWPIDRNHRNPSEWRRIAQWISSHQLTSQGSTAIPPGSLLEMAEFMNP
ncbi:MAG: hypothetical protein U0744_21990 [Gemmataceae bacterium]